MSVGADGLHNLLHHCICAYDFKLQDYRSKTLHKTLIDSNRPILTWNILGTLYFFLIEHIYWVTYFLDKAQKEVIERLSS